MQQLQNWFRVLLYLSWLNYNLAALPETMGSGVFKGWG
jgi:hypothetical protein